MSDVFDLLDKHNYELRSYLTSREAEYLALRALEKEVRDDISDRGEGDVYEEPESPHLGRQE